MEKIRYKFEEANIRDIQESPLNAQVMSEDDFNRLVKNIKKDGILTSSVLLMECSAKKLMCISGHHRIKAAKKAGIISVPAMIINEVDESTRIRLQLTHNDIHGTPDENIVAILQQKLNEYDINLTNWKDIEPIKIDKIDVDFIDFQYVSICLMPKSLEEFKSLINSQATNAEEKYLIDSEDYEVLKEGLTLAFKAGYKTPGKAFRRFLDLIIENKLELKESK